jgi:hypothetical protein
MNKDIAGTIVSHFSLDGITFNSTVEIDSKVIFTEKHTDSITLAHIASERVFEEGYMSDEKTVFSLENGSVLKNGKLVFISKFAIDAFTPFPMMYYADLFNNNIKRKYR